MSPLTISTYVHVFRVVENNNIFIFIFDVLMYIPQCLKERTITNWFSYEIVFHNLHHVHRGT